MTKIEQLQEKNPDDMIQFSHRIKVKYKIKLLKMCEILRQSNWAIIEDAIENYYQKTIDARK